MGLHREAQVASVSHDGRQYTSYSAAECCRRIPYLDKSRMMLYLNQRLMISHRRKVQDKCCVDYSTRWQALCVKKLLLTHGVGFQEKLKVLFVRG